MFVGGHIGAIEFNIASSTIGVPLEDNVGIRWNAKKLVELIVPVIVSINDVVIKPEMKRIRTNNSDLTFQGGPWNAIRV